MLLARDVWSLSPAQRSAREHNIRRLRRYRLRGVFPHNHDVAGRRVPFFVDRHGTRCAMAYLIEESGCGDLVCRIAAARNNAYVAELASDPELVAWLEREGLTAEEAAAIQPAYDPWGGDYRGADVSGTYAALSAVAAVLNGASIATNARAPRDERGRRELWPSAMAVATGGFGLTLAMTKVNDAFSDSEKGLVLLNGTLGAASLFIGLATLSKAVHERSNDTHERWVQAFPLVAYGPDRAAGVAVHLRF
jgi:hypothetical protein